jgi:hypothetical protein
LAKATLRLSPKLIAVLSWLGIALALGILSLGYADDWRAYAMIGSWALLGLLYWLAVGIKQMRYEWPQ